MASQTVQTSYELFMHYCNNDNCSTMIACINLIRDQHSLDATIFVEAIRKKDTLDILKCLKAAGCPLSKEAFNMAVKQGDVNTIKWLIDSNCPKNTDIDMYISAIKGGSSNLISGLNLLHTMGCPLSNQLLQTALQHCSSDDLLKITWDWLIQHGCIVEEQLIVDSIANLPVERLAWFMQQNKLPLNTPAIKLAIETCRVESLCMLILHRTKEMDIDILLQKCLQTKNMVLINLLKTMDIVKYAEWKQLYISFIRNNDLDTLKKITENITSNVHISKQDAAMMTLWNDDTIMEAAQNGCVSILEYVHKTVKRPGLWTNSVSIVAAENGHIEVLKFMHDNHLTIDNNAYIAAQQKEHQTIMNWLVANRYVSYQLLYNQLLAENENTIKERDAVKAENENIKAERDALKAENENTVKEMAAFKAENENIKDEMAAFKAIIVQSNGNANIVTQHD